MKKTALQKLVLNREIVCKLDAAKLARVAGGAVVIDSGQCDPTTIIINGQFAASLPRK